MRNLRRRPAARRAPARHRAGGARLDDRRDDASRPERPRDAISPTGSRSASGGSASSTSRAGISRSQRGRVGLGGSERRALQPPATSASACERRGHRFATRCDTEIIPHLYEDAGEHVPGAAARDVRPRRLGRARAAGGARARPARHQAALLRARSATCSSSPPSSRACSRAVSSAPSSTTRRSTRT